MHGLDSKHPHFPPRDDARSIEFHQQIVCFSLASLFNISLNNKVPKETIFSMRRAIILPSLTASFQLEKTQFPSPFLSAASFYTSTSSLVSSISYGNIPSLVTSYSPHFFAFLMDHPIHDSSIPTHSTLTPDTFPFNHSKCNTCSCISSCTEGH